MHRIFRTLRREHGNAALEGVIYMTVLIFLLALIAVAGRLAMARQSLEHVAFQAARTASLQRDASSAQAAAVSDAAATLAAQHLDCLSSSTSIDTSGFSAPLGQAATVSTVTSCKIKLSSFGIIPGEMTITGRASSSLDTYRARP